ncbi:MAG: V-type ATP synthase subunit E family protein [Solirubrobacteraceae bacterium]
MTLEAASEALLADAREEAQRLIAQAEDDALSMLQQARRSADELLAVARARGEAEGRREAVRRQAREGALARLAILAARREVYEELRRRARTAVLSLRDEPGYRGLLEQLASAARRDLGAEALLEIDPDDAGGVRARAGSRAVDYTLPALAEGCLEGLGPVVRRLWT